jgi:hypothetical protein
MSENFLPSHKENPGPAGPGFFNLVPEATLRFQPIGLNAGQTNEKNKDIYGGIATRRVIQLCLLMLCYISSGSGIEPDLRFCIV